jgi:hypothetical protein
MREHVQIPPIAQYSKNVQAFNAMGFFLPLTKFLPLIVPLSTTIFFITVGAVFIYGRAVQGFPIRIV